MYLNAGLLSVVLHCNYEVVCLFRERPFVWYHYASLFFTSNTMLRVNGDHRKVAEGRRSRRQCLEVKQANGFKDPAQAPDMETLGGMVYTELLRKHGSLYSIPFIRESIPKRLGQTHHM